MVYTSGGTHRSRPTNHMGSPLVFVGRHLRVPPCRMRDGFSPHCGESVPAAGASPRPTRSEHFRPFGGFWCVPAAGHIGPALRDHANPLPAGLRGLWPSHRNNAKHGLRTLPHPFRTAAPNHYKNSKSLNLKVLLDFFQKIAGVQGAAPPVAGRSQRNPHPPQRMARDPPAAGFPIAPAPRS